MRDGGAGDITEARWTMYSESHGLNYERDMPKSSLPKKRVQSQKRDSERTKATIWKSAFDEFSRAGYSGARMDRIASSAKCNVRLLYRYFGSKKQLYMAVLERAYADIRSKEAKLNLAKEAPLDGILKLAHFTFHYFAENPQFESLLNNENMMGGKFVQRSKRVSQSADNLRDALGNLIRRGEASGTFRAGLDPVQIYVTIAALSRFHHANAHSLSALLETDLTTDAWRRKRLEHAVELLQAYLKK